MTATPDQRLTAKARRGYSKEYLNQACSCGCARAAHKDRAGPCICGCSGFSMADASVQPAGSAPVKRKYNFGTMREEHRLPAGLREIPENITTHETITASGIMRAVTMDEAARDDPIVVLDEPIVVPRGGSATRCPFCLANDFETTPAVKCQTCNAWQHSECVREAGRCAACNTAWPV